MKNSVLIPLIIFQLCFLSCKKSRNQQLYSSQKKSRNEIVIDIAIHGKNFFLIKDTYLGSCFIVYGDDTLKNISSDCFTCPTRDRNFIILQIKDKVISSNYIQFSDSTFLIAFSDWNCRVKGILFSIKDNTVFEVGRIAGNGGNLYYYPISMELVNGTSIRTIYKENVEITSFDVSTFKILESPFKIKTLKVNTVSDDNLLNLYNMASNDSAMLEFFKKWK